MREGEEPEKRGPAFRKDEELSYLKGKSYFLGIGIDKYVDLLRFRPLKNPSLDITSIENVLRKNFDFEELQVFLNEEATRKRIYNQLYHYTESLSEDDSLLIYFAGHGGIKNQKKGGHPFWAPHDANFDDASSLLSNIQIKDLIESCAARHVFLVSDSCNSGTFLQTRSIQEDIDLDERLALEVTQKPSRWALCSGQSNQVVSDGKAGEHSPFAKAILKFLEENKSSCIHVSYLIYRVIKLAYEHDPKQIASGGPLPSMKHANGQFVLWPKNKIYDSGAPNIPHTIYQENESLMQEEGFPAIMPLITKKNLIKMEKYLRKSCELMLHDMEIPILINEWALKAFCEKKSKLISAIIGDMQSFKEKIEFYPLGSNFIYDNTEIFSKRIEVEFREEDFAFITKLDNEDLTNAINLPLGLLKSHISSCLQFSKEKQSNNNSKTAFQNQIDEVVIHLRWLKFMLEAIGAKTSEVDTGLIYQ